MAFLALNDELMRLDDQRISLGDNFDARGSQGGGGSGRVTQAPASGKVTSKTAGGKVT